MFSVFNEVCGIIQSISHACCCIIFVSLCSNSGTISYKAQSQDEEALVRAAARLLMVFANKSGNIVGKHNGFGVF